MVEVAEVGGIHNTGMGAQRVLRTVEVEVAIGDVGILGGGRHKDMRDNPSYHHNNHVLSFKLSISTHSVNSSISLNSLQRYKINRNYFPIQLLIYVKKTVLVRR